MTIPEPAGRLDDGYLGAATKVMRVLVVVGTRPEAIKLAPIIRKLYTEPWAETKVLLTGQHTDLVVPLVADFGISVDEHLQVMTPNQTLATLVSRLLEGIDGMLEKLRPSLVIAQGDTASVLASSLASFLRKIPFAHVEAGLRTGDIQSPFPEELNRVLTSRMTSWHFAPTIKAKENLLREGVSEAKVWVTGNTVIDTLKQTLREGRIVDGYNYICCSSKTNTEEWCQILNDQRPFILITAHRRENFGAPLGRICEAILALARHYADYDFVYPVHPNPEVRGTVYKMLSHQRNVRLMPPADYRTFCFLMQRAKLILSDSGGVQEEAPALGVPVLVLRDDTERPEAVEIGANRLVGTKPEQIIASVHELLNFSDAYARMATAGSPYGDGHAADAIVRILSCLLGIKNEAFTG
jgi:UDP-N-acetylglucosamine 2-epimerase (non-hydrolysing)